METKRLYYEDSHMRTFSARVTDCREGKGGFQIQLSATAFYPEGGGQNCDLGTLGDARVLDVQEKDGCIFHLCDRALTVGDTVTGAIDWERRFDHMQQHSGEHIVSGIVNAMFGYHNVGFHMGRDMMTIDFDGAIDPDALAQIEEKANRAVWADLPLRCWYPSPEELPAVPYRRKRELPWPVRIVEIPGIDLCACCGTHVGRTGEIGMIKLLSCVRFREGVRIELVCGRQALTLLNEVFRQNRQVSQIFSAKILHTADAARRTSEQLAAEKLRANTLQKQVFAAIAESCAGKENPVLIHDGLTPAQARELADAAAQVCPGTATVLSGTDAAGYCLCMVSRTQDVRPAGKAAVQALQGRGGGKPEAFQGNLKAPRKEIEVYFGL